MAWCMREFVSMCVCVLHVHTGDSYEFIQIKTPLSLYIRNKILKFLGEQSALW
jgi:hypothetical protein